jgi:Rad3-related DNA helicase
MKCKCGFETPAELAAQNNGRCASCGDPCTPDPVELLSRPALGLVEELRPGQIEYARAFVEMLDTPGNACGMFQAGCGIGKAQPLNAKVLGPEGWRRMGDLAIRDIVVGADGKLHRVTGIYPRGIRPIFRVTFTDGASTTCCNEHGWCVQSKKDRAKHRRGRLETLQELQRQGLKTGREHNHWIPIITAPDFASANPNRVLPLDPYLLGLLLGDGDFTVDGSCSFMKPAAGILETIRNALPAQDELSSLAAADHYQIVNRTPFRAGHRGTQGSQTAQILRDLALAGLGSHEKFVPEIYKWTTIANRHALLQGLLDTGGSVRGPVIEYSTTSPRLAEDVRFLVQSLGGVTSLTTRQTYVTHRGVRKPGQLSYRLHPCLPPTLAPFRLPRKANRYTPHTKYLPRRAIAKIEFIGNQEAQCIAVDASDHLYVTDDFIVTHNTFAYGLPAVLNHHGRVVIATGKKSLQDQLANKDLPFLKAHTGYPRTFVTMKGKSNYLCRRLLDKNKRLFFSRGQEKLYRDLQEWAKDQSHVGDFDTYPGQLEFPAQLCGVDECQKCGYEKVCGYRRRRAALLTADVAIVNHSLLGYDLRFGPGKAVLGPYRVLIVDEAHVAPGFLRSAFSQDLTETWMKYFINDLRYEHIPPLPFKKNSRDVIEDQWQLMFTQLPKTKALPVGVLGDCGHRNAAMLRGFQHRILKYIGERWGYITSTQPLTVDLDRVYLDLRNRIGGAKHLEDFQFLTLQLKKLGEKHQAILNTYVDDNNYILTREDTETGHIKVLRQPVNLAPLTGPKFATIEKLLFTSATLNPDALARELGVQPTHELSVPSPFPYERSLLYLPKHLPRPNNPQWRPAVAEEIVQLVRASRGNALVLFSAMEDLHEVRRIIDMEYALEYPLLAQGDGRKPMEVFNEFMQTENAVLFGSKSFFEGIDVKGEKLSLVIIPKLPFPAVKDPLTQAKTAKLGRDAFMGWSYPQMLQDVQQAAGRLIRTRDDRGVVAILDVRIWTAGDENLNPNDVGTKKLWRGYGFLLKEALPFSNYSPRRELVFAYFKMVHGERRRLGT